MWRQLGEVSEKRNQKKRRILYGKKREIEKIEKERSEIPVTQVREVKSDGLAGRVDTCMNMYQYVMYNMYT